MIDREMAEVIGLGAFFGVCIIAIYLSHWR
jgi:hypothetical protein